jgi:glycosyltransferase involved in cell wall biosynthesis
MTGSLDSAGVRRELLASRALVQPSFAEGLPMVIMEALALRRPVINTFIAGIPELVEPGVSGWLVPAGAIEPLADAMAEVLAADPTELEQMGRAGAVRVARNHNAATEARKLAGLIASRCASATRPEPARPAGLPGAECLSRTGA